MGFLSGIFGGGGGSSSSTSSSNKQTSQNATTQSGDAFASGGGTMNVTDQGVYEKGVNATKDMFDKIFDTVKTQSNNNAESSKRLVDVTENLLQRKTESDSKELSEKIIFWAGLGAVVFFVTRIFKIRI